MLDNPASDKQPEKPRYDKPVGKTEPVCLTSWATAQPSIHRLYGYDRETDAPMTACGRTLWPTSPIIRHDHARRIGRYCRKCFPKSNDLVQVECRRIASNSPRGW